MTGAELMLCAVEVAGQRFGLDTRKVREVIGDCPIQRVPLSPPYIAGVVTYRGEVLTTVSLRVVLGMEPAKKGSESCVLVLDGDLNWEGSAEQFGLQVDGVGGVVPVAEDLLRANPPALSEVYRAICLAAYRAQGGLLVQLDSEELKPVRLAKRLAPRPLVTSGTNNLPKERGAA